MARKTTYDQEKVKELRMRIIEDSLLVFSDDKKNEGIIEGWTKFRKDLLMKYANRVLPTLLAGRDDDKDLIPKPILDVSDNHSNKNNKKDEETLAHSSGRNERQQDSIDSIIFDRESTE